MDEEFNALVKKGKKTQQEVDSMIQLANEVQYAVVTKGLKPGENLTLFWVPGVSILMKYMHSDEDILQSNSIPTPRRRARTDIAGYGTDDGS